MPEALERIAELRSSLPCEHAYPGRRRDQPGDGSRGARRRRRSPGRRERRLLERRPGVRLSRARRGRGCLSCSRSAKRDGRVRANRGVACRTTASSDRQARRSRRRPLSRLRALAGDPPGRVAVAPRAVSRASARRLPLRDGRRTQATHGSLAIGDWERTWTAAEYGAAIEDVRAAIGRGDVYQVNLVQHLSAPFAGDPRALAARLAPLRPLQPEPFVTDTWAVVVRVSRALPRASRRPGLDDADQGNAPSRRRRRAPRRRRRTRPST